MPPTAWVDYYCRLAEAAIRRTPSPAAGTHTLKCVYVYLSPKQLCGSSRETSPREILEWHGSTSPSKQILLGLVQDSSSTLNAMTEFEKNC